MSVETILIWFCFAFKYLHIFSRFWYPCVQLLSLCPIIEELTEMITVLWQNSCLLYLLLDILPFSCGCNAFWVFPLKRSNFVESFFINTIFVFTFQNTHPNSCNIYLHWFKFEMPNNLMMIYFCITFTGSSSKFIFDVFLRVIGHENYQQQLRSSILCTGSTWITARGVAIMKWQFSASGSLLV